MGKKKNRLSGLAVSWARARVRACKGTPARWLVRLHNAVRLLFLVLARLQKGMTPLYFAESNGDRVLAALFKAADGTTRAARDEAWMRWGRGATRGWL